MPEVFADGGYRQEIGGTYYAWYYRNMTLAAGARVSRDVFISVFLTYLSATQVKVDYVVTCNDLTNSAPGITGSIYSSCTSPGPGTSIDLSATANDPDLDQVYYRWVYAEGDTSAWLGPYDNGQACNVSHSWATPGTYEVKVTAKDRWLASPIWSTPVTVTVLNCSCGDADGSGGTPDISDAVFLIAYIFGGGPAPGPCNCAENASGDADGSGGTPDISDAVYLIAYIFGGGPAPHCP